MTRQEILAKTLETFYKKLPEFLDTLTLTQLEKLELDLFRNGKSETLIGLVQEACRRNTELFSDLMARVELQNDL